MRFVALPGFRDVFPDALARRRRVFGVWREVACRYGFEEYDGPPLEPLDLLTAKSGDEIVDQLYSFTDKGGRGVALRPEMTPTLARMVGQRAAHLKKPIRWFSIPQLFRYERQQRGRLREHFQLNVDVIGEAGPAADAEVIAVAVDILRSLGFGPEAVRVTVSDRRVLSEALTSGLGVLEPELPGVLAAFDRFERSREAAEAALDVVFSGDAKRTHLAMQFAAALGDSGSLLRQASAEPLKACIGYLDAMGFGEYVDVDFRVVRGLAYYTGLVFEMFDVKRGLRSICGGGRYDTLIATLGGPDLPCVGFGMGDVVLGELLAERDGPPQAEPAVDVFIAMVREEERPAALALARELRDHGIRVEYPLKKQAVGKQLELANARGAAWAVIIGPKEYQAGQAVVRSLRSGEERVLELARIAEELEAGEARDRAGARKAEK